MILFTAIVQKIEAHYNNKQRASLMNFHIYGIVLYHDSQGGLWLSCVIFNPLWGSELHCSGNVMGRVGHRQSDYSSTSGYYRTCNQTN